MTVTTFVLYLFCLSCNPVKFAVIHDIPSFGSAGTIASDEYCKMYGDVLSGAFLKRNPTWGLKPTMSADKLAKEATKENMLRKTRVRFVCMKETKT